MIGNTKQPEALRLAAIAEVGGVQKPTAELIAAELRRQHAHIAEIEGQRNELVDTVCGLENKVAKLEAQLETIGASGVSALMPAQPEYQPLTLEQCDNIWHRPDGYSQKLREAHRMGWDTARK